MSVDTEAEAVRAHGIAVLLDGLCGTDDLLPSVHRNVARRWIEQALTAAALRVVREDADAVRISRDTAVMIAEWLDQTDNPWSSGDPRDQTWAAAIVARDTLNHALYPDRFDDYCHGPGRAHLCGTDDAWEQPQPALSQPGRE